MSAVSHLDAGEPVFLSQALWRDLAESDIATEAFAKAWLGLQCAWLSRVKQGVVVMGEADKGPFGPVAFWPEQRGGSLQLISVAELALEQRRGVMRDPGRGDGQPFSETSRSCFLGYPIQVDGALHGVVAVEIERRSDLELRAVMRQLQWGLAWVEMHLRRRLWQAGPPEMRHLTLALDMVAVALEKDRSRDAAVAVATELSSQLQCERVSIGRLRGDHIAVVALSHSAQFSEKSHLIAAIGQAMDEAMDQHCTLIYPSLNESVPRVLRWHEKLSTAHGGCVVCTVPFAQGASIRGAMTFEWPAGRQIDSQTVALCESVAALLSPIFDLKQREELWFAEKLKAAGRQWAQRLLGPEHYVLKAWLSSALLALLFLAFAKGDYRVTADTYIEGSIQRSIVAPQDGFIAAAAHRAGDVVEEGEALALLDDRDLVLERMKWESQRDQYLKQLRDASSRQERAEIGVLHAQLGQAEAQLALTNERLARTQLTAPFQGIVVKGDLSQSLGAPVARGEVLFEVAPLDAYRVILEVDERDMLDVRAGQEGVLVLTGESGSTLPFHVRKITSVSEAREGKNVFRVEAELESAPQLLRPGMKGVGKIVCDRRRLVWIWTHAFFDWLRLALWRFVP